MRSLRRSLGLTVGLAIVLNLFLAVSSRADLAPKWSDAELLAFSDVVLTGTVAATASGWDADTAYTYVTLEVGDVIKGWVPERQIILKQLGGRVGDLALIIGGQATFTAGEQVLVFLEARRRDRALSTMGLWQGKWTITTDTASGQRLVTRRVPGAADRRAFGLALDVRPLASWVQQLRAEAGDASRSPSAASTLVVSPRDARSAQPVDEVDAAALMNGISRDGIQNRAEPVEGSGSECFTRFGGAAALTWVAGDPCGDMGAGGGTMSISGYWARTAIGADADAADPFMQILHAGVVVNAGETAGRYLASPSCRAAITAHEIAHAQGQSHAAMTGAILDRTCDTSTSTLQIHPLGGAARQASAVSGAAVATGSTFTIAWDAADDSAATTYIIEAGSAPGLADLARFATGETRTSFLAAGVAPGIYYVRVYAANELETSPPSNEISLAVGGVAGALLPAPAALASSTNGSTVTLTWNAASGTAAAAYWIDAGSAPGLSDLASFSTASPATNFVATGVGTGTYFVRVSAMSGESIGPASNEVRLTVSAASGPCAGAPDAPVGLTRSVTGSTVTLAWNAAAGSPTSYVIEAGSSAGLSNLANFDTGSTSTTLRATGVGRGNYIVRVRARNACGTGAASNEVLAIVR